MQSVHTCCLLHQQHLEFLQCDPTVKAAKILQTPPQLHAQRAHKLEDNSDNLDLGQSIFPQGTNGHTCGLIQQQYSGFGEDGTGNGNALLLAP